MRYISGDRCRHANRNDERLFIYFLFCGMEITLSVFGFEVSRRFFYVIRIHNK